MVWMVVDEWCQLLVYPDYLLGNWILTHLNANETFRSRMNLKVKSVALEIEMCFYINALEFHASVHMCYLVDITIV